MLGRLRSHFYFFLMWFVTLLPMGLVFADGPEGKGDYYEPLPVMSNEHRVQVGRYSTESALASKEELEPLNAIIQVKFPQSIRAIGEAFHYLLARSGYRLASLQASDPGMAVLISRPLPEVHREIGPMRLVDALNTLAGPVFQLVLDPLNRLISFEVIERYRAMLPESLEIIDDREVMVLEEPKEEIMDPKEGGELEAPPPLPRHKSKPQHEAKAKPSPKSSGNYYGPVKRSETLFSIAGQLYRQCGVSRDQMMKAIFIENPKAFGLVQGKRSMQAIKHGSVLKVPCR